MSILQLKVINQFCSIPGFSKKIFHTYEKNLDGQKKIITTN
jgi:hypothetical protein